jgi:hypothetical protein
MGSQDPGDYVLYLDDQPIAEFTGLDDWQVDKDISYNEGPGGRAFGFNHQRHNNKVQFTISVRETSDDIEFLHELAMEEREVSIRAEIPPESENWDTYEVGQEVGLAADTCVLQPGTHTAGSGEAEDIEFEVLGIGPEVIFKDEQ